LAHNGRFAAKEANLQSDNRGRQVSVLLTIFGSVAPTSFGMLKACSDSRPSICASDPESSRSSSSPDSKARPLSASDNLDFFFPFWKKLERL
jgi:hypothetical protein